MNPPKREWLNSTQLLLFSIVVFLVPTNLFMKFFVADAYVQGILVDYLLVKLYLSDIFVIILLSAWCIELGWKRIISTLKAHRTSISVVVAFGALHLLVHLSSPHFVSSAWFIVKLLECWVLLLWIMAKKNEGMRQHLFLGIACAVLFQCILAGYQYLAQRPFFGYWFFGEPMFGFDPTVAKSAHPGALTILPYGTTTHPNVLAGVNSLFSLTMLYLAGLERKPGKWIAAVCFVIAAGLVSWIAESAAAIASLAIGVVVFAMWRLVTGRWRASAKKIMLCAAALMLIGVPLVISITQSTNPSVVRRNELQQIALHMFLANPGFGVGLNQFTTRISLFGNVSGTLRFLQPAHNLPLLWLAETGFLGIVFIVLILGIVHKKYSHNYAFFAAVGLPFILIISLDHYPMSVQSGMLMSAIFIAILLEKRKELH